MDVLHKLMSKTFKLISVYYVLIIIIGGAQIVWGTLNEGHYSSPTLEGFYSVIRFIFSVGILTLLVLKKMETASLGIVIESAINIFFMTFILYEVMHYILMSLSDSDRIDFIKSIVIETSWNLLLLILSIFVVGYIIVSTGVKVV